VPWPAASRIVVESVPLQAVSSDGLKLIAPTIFVPGIQ
jgi:hypothetical protein